MYWSLPYCFIFVPFKLSFYSLHCHDISSVGLVVFHKCLCIDLFFISCCHLFSKHDPCTNYLFLIAFTGESTAGCAANFVFALWMQILEDFMTETLCYLSSGIFVDLQLNLISVLWHQSQGFLLCAALTIFCYKMFWVSSNHSFCLIFWITCHLGCRTCSP